MSAENREVKFQSASLPEYTGDTTITREPSQAILEAVHLRKYFPIRQLTLFGKGLAVHAVEDNSLALYPGRALALVGESGSGKTTMARMLARLYDPTAGELLFRGKPVKVRGKRDLRAYRRHVQIVFQDPFSSLNPIHDVRYHLSRPLRLHGHAHNATEEREQILALLNRVSLSPAEQFIQKYPHQLSGGQRQRVAIARALAARPEVLLADEPVSMLDVSIRLDILNLLLRLKDEEQLALLFITPGGCRFHPRCPFAMPVCKERFPRRSDLGGGHWTHCFLYGDGDSSGEEAQNASKQTSITSTPHNL